MYELSDERDRSHLAQYHREVYLLRLTGYVRYGDFWFSGTWSVVDRISHRNETNAKTCCYNVHLFVPLLLDKTGVTIRRREGVLAVCFFLRPSMVWLPRLRCMVSDLLSRI